MDVFDSLCFLLLWHSFIYSISSPLLRHQTQKQVKPFLNILRRTFSSFFLFFALYGQHVALGIQLQDAKAI